MDQVSSSKSQRSSLSHSDSAPPTLKRNMQPCLSKEGNLDDTTGRRWGFCCRFATIHPVAPTWRQNMHQALWDCPSLHIPTEEPFWHLSWCLKTLFKSLYLPSQIFWHPDSTIDDWHEKHVTNYYHQLSWLWLTVTVTPLPGSSWWNSVLRGLHILCAAVRRSASTRSWSGQTKKEQRMTHSILLYPTLRIYIFIYIYICKQNPQTVNQKCPVRRKKVHWHSKQMIWTERELNWILHPSTGM